MSHTTLIKSVPIRSLTALESAIAHLQKDGVKCEFLRNSYPRMYSDRQREDLKKQSSECHTLKLNDSPYDVGFLKQEDGTFAPVFDDWNGHVKRNLGSKKPAPVPEDKKQAADQKHVANIGRLMQYYTAYTGVETLQEQGFQEAGWEENPQTGVITLTMAEATYY